jgi:crotonobetainyl-CoA:carnitine CoA-transferase CaiB-like acyl-CoA transferase
MPTDGPDPALAPAPNSTSRPPGPLAGILVVDCSTVLAGPYCTMLLADLGAEVIKVEPPEGDGTRAWGPPWVAAGRLGPDDPGVAAYYLAINRNKRSIRLDLRTPAGAEVLRGLIEHADVLVENFRVGGFERLGFSDAILDGLNRRLIHLAISGYGTTGPDATKPGYDFVIQAVAGLMSITGMPDADGGGPTKVGVAIADVITGILGSTAILAALEGRGRSDSPAHDRGQRIDLSLFESSLAVLINQAQNAFATGRSPGRRGNAHPNIVPYETFATADGQIAVAVGSERQWARFCSCLGVSDLAADRRFATNGDRVANRDELRPILAARLAGEPTTAWLERLGAAEIPCGPIQGVLEALESEQARAREMTVEVEHPLLGALRQVGVPFKLAVTPATIRSAPPLLGEHSTEILTELGYDEAAIDRLRADRVI